ncbi:MAG: hypothetical protein II401_11705, partial [Bacteroidales bacterium]|nr:hypothetical protein [Bacteroidales bacterium]
ILSNLKPLTAATLTPLTALRPLMPPPKVVKEKSPGAFEKHRSFCFFYTPCQSYWQGQILLS